MTAMLTGAVEVASYTILNRVQEVKADEMNGTTRKWVSCYFRETDGLVPDGRDCPVDCGNA